MKKKNWSVPTKDADKIMSKIEARLHGMFNNLKRGKEGNMKVVYPFAGGIFGDDCRLMGTYLGMEKKNNSEMYIRLIQADVKTLASGFGGEPFSHRWEPYHKDIITTIDYYTNPDNDGHDWI